MFRTRFKKQIVAEFLPPVGRGRKQKVMILCDGMPSIPGKQPLAEFLAARGYWVFYPRYRGAWESGGKFLEKSPAQDIADLITGLEKGRVRENAFGQEFPLSPDSIFCDRRKFWRRGGASCLARPPGEQGDRQLPGGRLERPARRAEKETSNPSYPAYLREAWGNAYRLSDKNWNKLLKGNFYNPARHLDEFKASKAMMFHAKDDPYIPWKLVAGFAKRTGIKLNLLPRGGHLSTTLTVQKHWPRIRRFFDSKS